MDRFIFMWCVCMSHCVDHLYCVHVYMLRVHYKNYYIDNYLCIHIGYNVIYSDVIMMSVVSVDNSSTASS